MGPLSIDAVRSNLSVLALRTSCRKGRQKGLLPEPVSFQYPDATSARLWDWALYGHARYDKMT